MNRLQLEVHRLYVPQAHGDQQPALEESALVDAGGRVCAMVLELARPADWSAMSKVWQGVQADLELPAPAIAVSGKEGYQLWFSLSEPVPATQAMAFLEALRVHYLGDIKRERIASMPTVDSSAPFRVLHASLVPAVQAESGFWSAFVAPDLAPVFAEEPWLDTPPSPSGQADLLSRLKSIQPADFERALAQLMPIKTFVDSPPASSVEEATDAGAAPIQPLAPPDGTELQPKRFLLDVMNNSSVALGLRIEAAKALLPYFEDPPRQ